MQVRLQTFPGETSVQRLQEGCHRSYLSTGCAAASAPPVAGMLQKLGPALSLAMLGHRSGAPAFESRPRFAGDQGGEKRQL